MAYWYTGPLLPVNRIGCKKQYNNAVVFIMCNS